MRTFYFLFFFVCFFSCGTKEKEKTLQNPTTDSLRDQKPSRQDSQGNPYASVDISPMDMSYYPPNYPQQRMSGNLSNVAMARIIYSRPQLQGRALFQDVLKYGEPWRLGANESTELELFRDGNLQDKKIKAGRYVLYCIPQQDSWTIKLNSNIDSWGLRPDPSKDIASFVVPVTQTNSHIEFFTIIFEEKDGRSNILMAWDNLEARLPISF